MRRELTAEQKAKAAARREQFKGLWKQVAEMTDEQRQAMALKCGYVTPEGHPFSLCNTMLLCLQYPTGSVFGGFKQWLKQGRVVRKGQHGHMIWCPTSSKKEGNQTSEPTSADTHDIFSEAKPGTESKGEVKGESNHRFVIGTVFDISQTDELPQDNENVVVNGVTVLEVEAA